MRVMMRALAAATVCVALLATGLVSASASGATSAVDLIMSLSDGGSPFVARQDPGTTSTPSGTWTLTVRNTGTSASSGTTQVVFSASGDNGAFLPSSGSGWSCQDTGYLVRTCTNGTAVRKGGSLPPLTFPIAVGAGSSDVYATANVSNPSNGGVDHSTLSIDTPLVEDPAVDLSMSLSDGGSPFVARQDPGTTSTPSGTWTLTVRNTGTSASSGTTQVVFSASGDNGAFLPSSGSGWSCQDTGYLVRTCTNGTAVPAGGSLPPLTFPIAVGAG